MDKVIDRTTGFHFTIIDNYILDNANLNHYEQIIYVHLKKYASQGNMCFPGINTLATSISVSTNTVRKTLKSLKEKGFIDIKQRFNDSNQYILLPYPEYKEEQTKEEISGTIKKGVGEVLKAYQNNINPTYGSMERDRLIKLFEDSEENAEIVIKAIEIAVEQGARKIRYIETILNDWYQQGIKTLEQAEAYTKIRDQNKRGDKNGTGCTSKNNAKSEYKGFRPAEPKLPSESELRAAEAELI